MGINNLLKVLESIQVSRHLNYYKGKRVAVDGYCWLHKSIYLLTEQILHNSQSKTYLRYLNKRVEQLLKFDIKPIIVFDGDKLQMKKIEEEERQKHRNEVIMESLKLIRQGKEREAQTKKIEGIDINPQMAYEFIKLLKQKKIEYFVAPYEADIQLAYLSKINYVDCVITEDSDLLALGCKRVLYKLDMDTNIGFEIELKNLKKCTKYDFRNFDEDKFLTFCILSGCDYFKIRGVGANNAYKIITSSSSYKKCITAICNRKECGDLKYEDLIEKFEKAFLTFRYQVVYCPIEKRLRYYSNIKKSKYKFATKYLDNLDFLGDPQIDSEIVQKTTFGEIDPITHLPFDFTNLTKEEKEKVQENYLNKKRKMNDDMSKQEEDEFNLDINLDIRGSDDEEKKKNENKIDYEFIFDEYSFNNNEKDILKNNMNKNNNNNNSLLLKKKNFNYSLKNELKENQNEFGNYINNKNYKNNDLKKYKLLSEFNEYDDFLNSYDKVNEQLKNNIFKDSYKNIQFNCNGNKISIMENENRDKENVVNEQ